MLLMYAKKNGSSGEKKYVTDVCKKKMEHLVKTTVNNIYSHVVV